MNSDITNYFRNESEIAELKAEIAELNKKVRLLTAAKSKYKRKYEEFRRIHGKPVKHRGDTAKELVVQKLKGELDITNREIAKRTFLSEATIRNITFKVKRELP